MPTTPRLPLRLHEKLGDEAMTELLTLFGDLGAETRAEFQELRGEFHELKQRMETGFAEARRERAELKHSITDVKQELKQEIADVRERVADVKAELIKWTFLFWLGTIGIVLLLLRFPA